MLVAALVDAADPERFGAKTATLASLAATYRVPHGYAIAADANGDLRPHVERAHAELVRAVGHEPDVAVRSSAIGEDSRDASFAGQHETVLGVRGVDAVLAAADVVVRSATSERAIAYRREKGIDAHPRVAVLVQRMVRADASVIAFTADPVTGDTDLVVINAARGLGEAMASGEVTPDAIQVRKSDRRIEWRRVAGTDGPVLDEERVREVAELALRLERERGHPVDVEAAYEGGTLWLLQCRPVTAAGRTDDDFRVVWPRPGDERLTWRREDSHHGVIALPLTVDYTRHGSMQGIQRRQISQGLPLRTRMEEFNGRIYVGVQPLAPPEEVAHAQERAGAKRRELGRRLVRDWPERLAPAVRAHLDAIRAVDPAELPAERAAADWTAIWSRLSDIWEIHMIVTGGAYPLMDELASTYEELTGRPGIEAFDMTRGLARTLQQLQRDTFALVETARSLPDVAGAIRGGVEAPDVLRDVPGGERFTAALGAFLERHGDVGQPNDEIDTPAWSDDPAALVREVRRGLETPAEDPDARLARLLANGEAIAERARAIVRRRHPDRLPGFEELLEAARVVGPLTEEHNYWIDRRSQAVVRRAALAFGARLVADGSIERAEDIFHFYVDEVSTALRAPSDRRTFVAERKARLLRYARMRHPELIGAPPPSGQKPGLGAAPSARVDLLYTVAQDDASVLKGVAAGAGVGRGPARLVRSAAEIDRVRPGDVLVCRSTNVSWVPAFGKVAAVVTEVGGSLSHAAVVAREFGVPCVVATGVALTLLRDGEVVEVDGSSGIVRRIGARSEAR